MTPFAPGSVSLRLYPHDLAPSTVIEEMRAQAALAVDAGFHGVMTSEHHGGFAGYLPNPLQVAGWLLEAMPAGWAAPCPMLLPLRPAALVAEEVAWLAARFPGRVGLGVAAGALEQDFTVMGAPMGERATRFAEGIALVAAALRGEADGVLAGDPAIRACARSPVPVLSAAMSATAVRRAAAYGVGLILDSLTTAERTRELVDEFRAAGGTGPCVLIRKVWVGPPPGDLVDKQVDVYRSYSGNKAQATWSDAQLVSGAGASVAERLAADLTATGADALNLRIHVPGVDPRAARDQIQRLGDEVLPSFAQRGVSP